MNGLRIRSGGQTGVDRTALDFALSHAIAHHGWCPQDGWAEDAVAPPGILARYPNLRPTPAPAPEQRTAWNVRDSDATLILAPPGALDRFPGTAFTRLCCEFIFQKRFFVGDLSHPSSIPAAAAWLRRQREASCEHEFDLNIAGPRESEASGIYDRALSFLEGLWRSK